MESIQDKYKRIRPSIKHGDLILFHGTGVMAKIIQNCDNSYYNHVGVVIEINEALFIVDSNADGVQADRLSWRIGKYSKGGDFCIIQSNADERSKYVYLKQLLKRSDENWIKYDYYNGAKELANRKFGLKLRIKEDEGRDICSDYVSRYAVGAKFVSEEFAYLKIAFPQDYIRYMNEEMATLIH